MIALPKGQILVEAEGTVIAQVRASRSARKEMRDWFDRLAASRPRRVMAHIRVDDGQRGFEVHYEPQPREAVSLLAAIDQWWSDPAGSIPVILELGRFVFEVAGELAGRGFGDALVAPATVRLVPGSTHHWRLVPLPTGGSSLADWARAEPDTWLWVTRETVIGGAPLDPVYVLGAALHHAIAGPLVPKNLPAREKFPRLLRGRMGLRARLGAAIRSALPRSLEADAAILERLILDCLEPNPTARPSADSVRERLSSLADKLATERLIRYWAFENQQTVVSRLKALVQEPPAPSGAAAPPPPPAPVVPWDEQVPTLVGRGDLAGALEAAWNDIHDNGPPRIRFYMAVVQRIAARLPGPSTEVTAAIDRLVGTYGDKLDESDVLRLAHIRVRHLGERSDRLGTAHRQFASRWNDATARLMQARVMLTTGQAYNQVSRLCKEARGLYDSMPEKGGKAGHYAMAYLHLLDGIAHVGAVSLYRNESFYNDAFDQFGRALDMASRAGHDALTHACLRWFGWLGQFTVVAQGPPLSLLAAGIEAVLRSHGLTTAAVAAAGVPEIPWYDELLLFPV
jgi:hypothetical protein